MEHGIIVRMAGGLGNQMFQYAAARALSLRLSLPLTLDLSFYDRRRHRRYELGRLPLAGHRVIQAPAGGWIPRMSRKWISALQEWLGMLPTTYRESHFHFDPGFEGIGQSVALVGGFQSERYFKDAASQIRTELTPPPAADELSVRLAHEMSTRPSCAIHVRRGDYISSEKNRNLYAACGLDYYMQAASLIPADCRFYVFSDDMAWAREHLRLARPMIFVDSGHPRDALSDLWLMRGAEHHIIANSTLSWWGAWLKTGQGHIVAPKRWFADTASLDDRDLVPSGWTRV